jgi:hypothetical protein
VELKSDNDAMPTIYLKEGRYSFRRATLYSDLTA